MALASKDIYKFYVSEGGKQPYNMFMSIISEFNQLATDRILEGEKLDMGSRLSTLEVVKVERTFNKLKVNYAQTRLLRLSGDKETIVYHTDDFFCRFYWDKWRACVKNKSYYKVVMTRGFKGNTVKLARLLQSDDTAHRRFRIKKSKYDLQRNK